MAPVVKELQRRSDRFKTVVCVTGQHREMLDQVLDIFDIRPDYDLNIMQPGQDLYDISSRILLGMRDVLATELPADTCGACGSRPADLQHLQPLARRDEPPAERPSLHLAFCPDRARPPEPAEGEHPRRANRRYREHRNRRPSLGGDFGQSESPPIRTRREPPDGAHHRPPPRELRRRNGPYLPGNQHACRAFS